MEKYTWILKQTLFSRSLVRLQGVNADLLELPLYYIHTYVFHIQLEKTCCKFTFFYCSSKSTISLPCSICHMSDVLFAILSWK
jgi:hypothetical protein